MKLRPLVSRLAAVLAAVLTMPALAAPAACHGTAPSGELQATRIAAATINGDGQGLYEGPVWIRDALYFSHFTFGPDFPSRILKLDANGKLSTFIADSGSNGLAADGHGNILAATHKYKGVSRFTLAGQRADVVRQYGGQPFNSPNDLAMAADGTLYFSDPDFQRAAAPGGQDKTRVYRVGRDGAVSVVDETLANPNGVSLSPAGDVLYVNGNAGGTGVLRAYAIVDGLPQQGRDLVKGLGTADGMAVDCLGNLYVTEHSAQRLRVFTPAGRHIATIKVDANVTNAAFGGADGKTLFITGAGAVWQLRMGIAGAPY